MSELIPLLDKRYAPDILTVARRYAMSPVKRSLPAATLGNSLFAGVNGVSFSSEGVAQGAFVAWINNGGVAGNTSAQMLARFSTDVPSAAEALIFGEGPNDIGTSVTTATHRANLEAIVNAALARGITPVLIATSPRNGYAVGNGGYLAAEMALAYKYGIGFFDPWIGNTVDITTGDPASGTTSDGIHYVLANGLIAATNLGAYLSGATPDSPFTPRSNVGGTPGYCLLGGNNFLLTNSGDVPSGWTLGGSASGSIQSAPSGYRGSFARVTGNSAGGSSTLYRTISSGWQAGDTLVLSAAIQSDGTAGSVSFGLNYDSGASLNFLSGSVSQVAAHRVVRLFTPSTTASMTVSATVNNSVTGNFVQFGEIELYNLTAALTR